jgi:hypothetical protein
MLDLYFLYEAADGNFYEIEAQSSDTYTLLELIVRTEESIIVPNTEEFRLAALKELDKQFQEQLAGMYEVI